MSRESDEYKISDYNYITSALGNAFFSGVSFDQLWMCVSLSDDPATLDAAVSAQVRMNELIKTL